MHIEKHQFKYTYFKERKTIRNSIRLKKIDAVMEFCPNHLLRRYDINISKRRTFI